MAEPILQSLETLADGYRYTVFEQDQILTHSQLNDLADHLDDQDRLTRVGLIGVGLAEGLRVRRDGDAVALGRGVGITCDGDLLQLPAGRRYDRFRPYDQTAPIYPLFYKTEMEMWPVFELVAVGAQDDESAPLSDFDAQSGQQLAEMVAVLYMESYVRDEDLCTGTDCDNLGRRAIHATKLLLVPGELADRLRDVEREKLPTLDRLARALPEVVAERLTLGPDIQTLAQLNSRTGEACKIMFEALDGAIAQAGPFVAALGTPPLDTSLLEAHRSEMRGRTAGLQYFYEFLTDLAETWNACREAALGDATVSGPDFGAFAKHLLLGPLTGDDPERRTAFYPSPLLRPASGRDEAAFLAAKLNALLRAFKPPEVIDPRITPGRSRLFGLEERPMPYYYLPDGDPPLFRHWNSRLSRRGLAANVPSFHADRYNPAAFEGRFRRALGDCDFFRVEGAVGHPVERVLALLNNEIASHNLPIQVQAVALAPDRKQVRVKPRLRASSLVDLHQLLRQDLVVQLQDSRTFSSAFKAKVDEAVDRKVVVEDADGDAVPVRQLAEQKNAAVQQNAMVAAEKLGRGYADYKTDSSWRGDLGNAQRAAGEFKQNLGKVVRTEFATPFDSLIGANQGYWLGWLDTLIQDREDRADDDLLATNFARRFPGMDYAGGVGRGGTLILVYDTNGTVVADFALDLPYQAPIAAPAEPVLPRPAVKPPFVLEAGVEVTGSRERAIKEKLTGMRAEIEEAQRGQASFFNESVRTLGSVIKERERAAAEPPGRRASEPMLDLLLQEQDVRAKRVDLLRQQSLSATGPRQAALTEQLAKAELGLANAIGETSTHLATSGDDLKEGSDGARAMAEVSQQLAKINNKEALEAATTGLKQAREKAPEALKNAINNAGRIKNLRL